MWFFLISRFFVTNVRNFSVLIFSLFKEYFSQFHANSTKKSWCQSHPVSFFIWKKTMSPLISHLLKMTELTYTENVTYFENMANKRSWSPNRQVISLNIMQTTNKHAVFSIFLLILASKQAWYGEVPEAIDCPHLTCNSFKQPAGRPVYKPNRACRLVPYFLFMLFLFFFFPFFFTCHSYGSVSFHPLNFLLNICQLWV